MIKRGDKRALSDIVAVLIVVLLVLVAVGIVWVVVRNVIQRGAEQIELGKLTLDLEIEKVQLMGDNLRLVVKRNPGEGEFVGLNFIVEDGDNSEVFRENVSMAEYAKQTFAFTLVNINPANIEKISIAPVFKLKSGKEVVGDIKDEYEFTGAEVDRTLVGYWSMDYSNATGIYDSSMYNNFASFRGGLSESDLVTGAIGQGLQFDGTDDYLIADFDSDFGIGDFTISAWVNFEDIKTGPGTDQIIFSKRGGISHPSQRFSKIIFGTDDESYKTTLPFEEFVLLTQNSSDSVFSVTNTSEIKLASNLNKLYHVVVTRSGSTAKIYVNGNEASTDFNDCSSGDLSTTEDVYIGAHRYLHYGYDPPRETINAYFNGIIDELMVWDRALSQTEISDLYNLGAS